MASFPGQDVSLSASHQRLAVEARTLAASMPDLLLKARQVANTVSAGWHGRRRAGSGEHFWQFRSFNFGEPARRIDWRRSARDERQLYVREHEMENAHTAWLWVDLTASMHFASTHARAAKRDRALVLTIALAELLAKSGERVGLLGHGRPVASRNAAERVALSLAHADPSKASFKADPIGRFHDIVLIGDFLDPAEDLAAKLADIAARGSRAHLVQVLDPVEETFPFSGRTEFTDPETGARLTAGRAEAWRKGYADVLSRHRDGLRSACRHPGWSFLLHRTDRPASEALLALHARLSESVPVMGGMR